MLFNSYQFIFLYLPVVWAVFYLLGRSKQMLAAAWLAAASVFFYGFWDPHYVPLLLASIACNYFIGKKICDHLEQGRQLAAKRWLQAGLVFDLGLLGYYKYTGFILGSWVELTGANLTVPNIILPLGISFFTFTQIAYLVDAYRGIVRERTPVHYLLFISYFPHLIAGPVLHHKQMMPQFAEDKTYRINHENIAIGLTIFTIGMVKKVLIADSLAGYANPVFNHSLTSAEIPLQDAWIGALAYALQLYFDFSGYSDMAIGLSRLFGIQLPLNFNSPYKSKSIIDFWRRWHMTLSQFLRDYLYFTLGGNRLGKFRRYINLFLTMLLGGIWHGAGWNFAIWGVMHGGFLIVNHIYRDYIPSFAPKHKFIKWCHDTLCWALTFICVVIAFVVFRAETLSSAINVITAMLPNLNATALPEIIDSQRKAWQLIGLALCVALFAPNTQEIMGRYQPAWDAKPAAELQRWQWRPNKAFAIITALSLFYCIVNIGKVSEFLYFQF